MTLIKKTINNLQINKRYYYIIWKPTRIAGKDHFSCPPKLLKRRRGSIRITIDKDGEIVSAQDYPKDPLDYPFGAVLRSYNAGDVNNKYKLTEKERDVETGLDYFGARYYDPVLGICKSVDPLWEKTCTEFIEVYPGWSPYNYVLNNPLRFIDPDGMWSAERDENGNIIARYEDGDTYENLYTQLGMSTEEFASWTASQGIQLSLDGSGMSFNITDFVLKQNDFALDNNMMNCFSSSLYGTGALSEEMPILGGSNFTQESQSVFGFEKNNQAQIGSMVTWQDNSGTTHHSAIFVIKGQDGTEYFVGRPGPNSNVAIQTSRNTSQLYPSFQRTFLTYPFSKP